jgi:hypothetical protein
MATLYGTEASTGEVSLLLSTCPKFVSIVTSNGSISVSLSVGLAVLPDGQWAVQGRRSLLGLRPKAGGPSKGTRAIVRQIAWQAQSGEERPHERPGGGFAGIRRRIRVA